MSDDHAFGYTRRDREVVDYQPFVLSGTRQSLRGPEPTELKTGRFVVCLGAAQTFGCFCPRPFPHLLQESLNLPVLNLGVGGAGPAYFLQRPEILSVVNRARLVVVQVMSGRSESNRVFKSDGETLTVRADGRKLSADQAYRQLLEEEADRLCPWGPRFLRQFVLALVRPKKLRQIVAETRQNWLTHSRDLLSQIQVPKVLFYFSVRRPHYWSSFFNQNLLFGRFPQLVNSSMITSLRPFADRYVECVTGRGLPQRLVSRFHGGQVTVSLGADGTQNRGYWQVNRYYPSPEMHRDAFNALLPVVRQSL